MTNREHYIYYNEDDGGGRKNELKIVLAVVAAVCAIAIFFFGTCVGTYNKLVDMEEDVNLAFANVQSTMQSRIEKIPDLVKVADEAAEHLERIYEDIAEGRSALSAATTPEELEKANAQVTENINQFLTVVENYPTITASEQYTALMDSIEGAANRINVAREKYNEEVSDYNRVVRRFPGSLIAGMYGFETMEPFEADEAANNNSVVDFDN